MSTIAGVGGSSLSLMGFKTDKRDEVQQQEALFAVPTAVPNQRTVESNATYDYLAQQATEEGFARLRVPQQTTSVSTTQSRVESSTALQEFKAYMSKSPIERMRDSILKEMGLTKEDVEAMPPEKQKAIAEEIAERMKVRAQLQTQADRPPEEQVYVEL